VSENVPQTLASDALLSDDSVLAFTQAKRKEMVDQMTQGGIPTDNKDRALLLMAMGDMDRSALGNKKIGAKERSGQADRAAALIIASLGKQLGGNSPFQALPGSDRVGTIPTLDNHNYGELTLAPGETDVGIAEIGFDEFMAKMEGPSA
jgi:hypothetical protein